MEGSTVGLGDAMIMSQGANGGCNIFVLIVLLFALMGGGAWGANRDSNVARIQDVYASNDNQTLNANVRDLSDKMFRLGNGISDATFALQNTATNGFANLGRDIAQGTYVLDKAITDSRYVLGKELNENRFAAQQNTNAIIQAMNADGEKTRALIVQDKIEALQMKVAEQDRMIQSRDFALSQLYQTNTLKADIIGAVRPFPIPSFPVGNPYGVTTAPNCGYTAYNA